jgi:hypothetical protein
MRGSRFFCVDAARADASAPFLSDAILSARERPTNETSVRIRRKTWFRRWWRDL